MKLLFIRHGDPDYTIDSLTECSWLIKKHNKTGQGQSAPPLFRARQIIG